MKPIAGNLSERLYLDRLAPERSTTRSKLLLSSSPTIAKEIPAHSIPCFASTKLF